MSRALRNLHADVIGEFGELGERSLAGSFGLEWAGDDEVVLEPIASDLIPARPNVARNRNHQCKNKRHVSPLICI